MAQDYKPTLNLPNTSFPMKANLPQKEPERIQFWESLNIEQQWVHRATEKKFTLLDGPPYANGALHIGHAVNKILKDTVNKSRALSGYSLSYVPGWDCHGLPIAHKVEKKIGKPGNKVDYPEFRQACRDYAHTQIDLQRESFKRMGVIGRWDQPYLTMAFRSEATIVRSLAKIIANGHLTQGFKPVYWCPECGSSLAEAEIEYQDKTSDAIDVGFELKAQERLAPLFDCALPEAAKAYFPIWTTTPWTLPANEAVAVHPELSYVLVYMHQTDEKPAGLLVLAEELHQAVLERYGVTEFEILGQVQGKALKGLKLEHPFDARQVPVVCGDHVTVDAGTGLVHTAPSHGVEDYQLAAPYHLPVEDKLNAYSCFKPGVHEALVGQHVYKANPIVLELLEANGNLLHAEKLKHSYPHCWRHKTPVIFRATPQWFISMDKAGLRKKALEAIQSVQWIPGWGQARIEKMIENRPDWCVSRQRTWGVPMCLITHKETSELHPEMPAIMEKVAQAMETQGLEAWHELSLEALGVDSQAYQKLNDTLDVWFDSGVVHEFVLNTHDEMQWPADLFLEGSDQHRGWFQSSLLTAVAMYGKAPYKAVMTHGYTVDPKGHKMSKSLGNIVSPDTVIQQYGADILRLWIAGVDYKAEMPVSMESFKQISEQYRRIRNTARYLLGNTHDFQWDQNAVAADQLLSLDRWVLQQAAQLQKEIQESYETYAFHQVAQKISHFCSITLGSFYLDVIKDRLYTMGEDSLGRRSAQTTLWVLLQALVRWMMPVLSATAEEIWQLIRQEGEEESVLLATWYEPLTKFENTQESTDWDQVMQLRSEVNKHIEQLRANGEVKSNLDVNVNCYVSESLMSLLKPIAAELRFVLITSGAQVLEASAKPDSAVATELEGLWLTCDVLGIEKCERCWHQTSDIGSNEKHPTLCGRCIENIEGHGEKRQFA